MNKLLGGLIALVLLAGIIFVGVSFPKADEASRGLQGEQGLQGAQGAQGERGLRGLSGQSVNLQGLSNLLSSLGNLLEELEDQQLSVGALSGPNIQSRWLCVNDDCTYHLQQTFIDASTTIISIPGPFLQATSSMSDIVVQGTWPNAFTSATSTVELARLNITGVATSSLTFSCGASALPYASSTYNILNSGIFATSSTGLIENNLTLNPNNTGITGGTVAKIALTPTHPYLVCMATTTLPIYKGALTEVTNTFDGKATIRISKTR